MAQVLITRKLGRKYQVSLSGHNHALGEIECLVTLPDTLKTDIHGAHMRVAIARAAELNEELTTVLLAELHRIACSSFENSDPAGQ